MLEPLEAFTFVAGDWKTAVRAPASTPVDVRVLTWNVWFGAHMFEERRAALLVDLERRKPDVICLQEVTKELLDVLLETKWVRSAYTVSDLELFQTYDVAILSRLPIRKLSTLPLPTQMGRRLLVVELACGLTIGTVHLESMKQSTQPRASQLRLIQPALAELGDAVLCGDMNFQPTDEIETAALDPAFLDVWPAIRPDDPGYTADSQVNRMRFSLKPAMSRKRIDRVFIPVDPATAAVIAFSVPVTSSSLTPRLSASPRPRARLMALPPFVRACCAAASSAALGAASSSLASLDGDPVEPFLPGLVLAVGVPPVAAACGTVLSPPAGDGAAGLSFEAVLIADASALIFSTISKVRFMRYCCSPVSRLTPLRSSRALGSL